MYAPGDFTDDDVVAIDAAGSAVATMDSDGLHFADETVASASAYPEAVTQDGTVILVDSDGLVSLFGSDGSKIADVTSSDSQVRIIDGHIIVFDTGTWSSRVYLPAA